MIKYLKGWLSSLIILTIILTSGLCLSHEYSHVIINKYHGIDSEIGFDRLPIYLYTFAPGYLNYSDYPENVIFLHSLLDSFSYEIGLPLSIIIILLAGIIFNQFKILKTLEGD